MTIKEAIATGDIIRDRWPVRIVDHLNLYLGSGRCGACFDAYGLMHCGQRGWPDEGSVRSQSNTTFMHADHWHRGDWGLDYWLPVTRLRFAGEPPPPPTHYRQELRLHDGRLTTRLGWPGLEIIFTAYFHPGRRDVLAVEVRYQGSSAGTMPRLMLAPEVDLQTHYNQRVKGSFATIEHESASWWLAEVSCGTACSAQGLAIVSADGTASLEPCKEGMAIQFHGQRGTHLLLIGSATPSRVDELRRELRASGPMEQYCADATAAWHDRWGEAWIHVPVTQYQAMWARSVYYILSSYAPDVRSPAAPMGWSGNGWPFHFPQDVSCIHPVLLRLGHLDIARSWIEYYAGQIDMTARHTARIYKARGTMWSWEHPIGPDSPMLEQGTPNWFQYEIHNAAYPARMAYETTLYARDAQWARQFSWPVVRESARFYGSVLREQGDGSWGIQVTPSMGQDENGGRDGKNYLCALFSARYTLTVALRMSRELGMELPDAPRWEKILADGLAFGRLYDKQRQLCVTCEGLMGANILGKQKHPVQLNPLVFLPLDEPDGHVFQAYQRRCEICGGSDQNVFRGWTLAAFWLASTHAGDAAGLMRGLGQALPAQYVDPDWIQIYETSGSLDSPFFITSHGLYAQALMDALCQCYWNGPQVGAACPPQWQDAGFGNLHIPGQVMSGRREGGVWKVSEGR